jgi:pimeloyl-ACP methyl ester carboxylesterase
MLHGFAASLHDWDELLPDLASSGYGSYALDLLGHGDSPKPDSRAYHIDWVFDHFLSWMKSLHLTEPAVLVGHSLGGYLALEYARRVSAWTRGLVLVNPLYSLRQLPPLLRRTYHRPRLNSFIVERTPGWIFRMIVDVTSIAMGRASGAWHALPSNVRLQTAQDYARAAPGIYNLPNTWEDLTPHLPSITFPTLVVWGERDQTLLPASFPRLVDAMPRAIGKRVRAGHALHQSNALEFNQMVREFLREISW